jgi:hypothetical protein
VNVSFPTRVLASAGVLAIALGLAGYGWGRYRFGADDAAAARRLEREVRASV